MKTYQEKKQETRELAQHYQEAHMTIFWSEIIDITTTLQKLGRRYGLLQEFRNEGII